MVSHLSDKTALDTSPIAFAYLHTQVLMVSCSGWYLRADWQFCAAVGE